MSSAAAPARLPLAPLAALALFAPACEHTPAGRGDLGRHDEPADFEPVENEKFDGPLETFDRDLLLDDAVFTNVDAVTTAAVQDLLAQSPYGRRSFLADEQVGGRPFSEVLVEVAAAHGLNPILLLTRLQVEQSLVSKSTRPAAHAVDYALGCGCPGGGKACDPKYRGLAAQLECGATTLRKHYDGSANGTGQWRAGSPRKTQDGITITPGNDATASLYAYTPWVLEQTGGNWLVWNVTRKYVSALIDRGAWNAGEEMPEPTDEGSCVDHCGSTSAVPKGDGTACFCDEACIENGDCCDDFGQACEGGGGGGECVFEGDPGTAARVHIVYLVPSDREVNEKYRQTLVKATRDLQLWYASQTSDGSTFTVHEEVVDVLHTEHPAEWYSTHIDGDPSLWFWNNVLADAFPLTGGDFDQEFDIWAYYIDADGACGQIAGSGTSGVAVLPANDLRGLAGEQNIPPCADDPPDNGARCRWVGGLAHELGHAFGRPHPDGCDTPVEGVSCDENALLYLGYASYPNTYLTEPDKTALASSKFFAKVDLPSCELDCSTP